MGVLRVPRDTNKPLVGWEARWKDASGASRRRLFKGSSKRRAEAHLAEQLTLKAKGEVIDVNTARRLTVAECARQWAEAQPHAASTVQRVKSNIDNHIDGTPLGRMAIGAVRPSHVQAWVTGRSQSLSPGTTRLVLKLLRSVLLAAVEDGLIARSPARNTKLPRADPPKITPLTVDDVMALAEAIQPRMRAMVITQAGLGLRLGELIGLRVQDVDFLRRVVRVRGQNRKLDRTFTATKTVRSIRTIPLPDVVAKALAAHTAQWPPLDDGTIFSNRAGKPWHHEHYGFRWIKTAAKRAELPESVSSHDLRHHYASQLLANGATVAEVAELLGDTIAVVSSTYLHATTARDDRARKTIDNLWDGAHRGLKIHNEQAN